MSESNGELDLGDPAPRRVKIGLIINGTKQRYDLSEATAAGTQSYRNALFANAGLDEAGKVVTFGKNLDRTNQLVQQSLFREGTDVLAFTLEQVGAWKNETVAALYDKIVEMSPNLLRDQRPKAPAAGA